MRGGRTPNDRDLMKRTILGLAAAAVLVTPAAAQAGTPYVLGNVKTGVPTVTAGPAGVFHVVWNDENANVIHYCQVLKGTPGCSKSLVVPFNDGDGGLTGAPGKSWIVRDVDTGVLHLTNAQYVSGDTYVRSSTDGGTSFGPLVKVHGGALGTQGTDSQRPLYEPAAASIVYPTVNTGLYTYESPLDGSAAASEAKADLDQTGLGIRSYHLGLATLPQGTIATADNLENVYTWLAPSGSALDATPSWGAPKLVGPGYDSTMHGAGGQVYVASTAGGGGNPRFEVRKWTGTAFSKPKLIDKAPGYQARMYVSDGGEPGVVYRDNDTGLRYSSSPDGGKTFATKLVTNSDEVYHDLELAHDDDGAGLAVWTRDGAIAAADLTEVRDPTAPAKSATVSKKGTTLGLNVTGSCVVPGKTIRLTVGGQGVNKVEKVRFRLGGQAKTDLQRKWAKDFKVPGSAKPGASIGVGAKANVASKKGKFTITMSTTVTVCGG